MSDDLRADFERLVVVTHHQKGELLYLQTMITAILRALPRELQAETKRHFDASLDRVRNAHLYSSADDAVRAAFEHYVANLENPKSRAP